MNGRRRGGRDKDDIWARGRRGRFIVVVQDAAAVVAIRVDDITMSNRGQSVQMVKVS